MYLSSEDISTKGGRVFIQADGGVATTVCSDSNGAEAFAAELRRFVTSFNVPADPSSVEKFMHERMMDSWNWPFTHDRSKL